MSIGTPGYPRIFHGHSRVRDVSTMSTSGGARVFAMQLSPDGRFLAIGDEDGTLEIRAVRSEGAWRRVGLYSTGGAVRTLVWHPLESGTVFSGSANGALHRITVMIGGDNLHCDALVSGYIHLLSLSPDGQRLIIAHGQAISVVNNPFPHGTDLGTLVDLGVPAVNNTQSLSDYHIPRGIFFLSNNENVVLVAFLGRCGLIAYSLVNQQPLWSIPLRMEALIGSAAISPSGERVAVMNLRDGIDFYSTSRRQYLSTTKYNLSTQVPPQNFIVDVLFVDDDTVAFGHSDGHIGFATFGIDHVDTVYELGSGQEIVQVITFGFVSNTPLIFGLASPVQHSRSSMRSPSDIHIGRIETPGILQGLSGRIPTRYATPSSPHLSTISMIAVVATIAVTCLSILVGQTPVCGPAPPTSTTPAPCIPIGESVQYFSTVASAFDPLSTCICTVTGTVDVVKESGTI